MYDTKGLVTEMKVHLSSLMKPAGIACINHECLLIIIKGVKDSRVYASLAARGADIIHEMDPHSMALLAYALAKNGHFAMAYQTSFISMVERLGPNAFTYNSLVHIVTAWAWSRVRYCSLSVLFI